MRTLCLLPILLALIAATAGAQAENTVEFGHRVTPADGQTGDPMAWRYKVLQAARNVFDERAAAQAPGAVLAFRLPKPALGQEFHWLDPLLALGMGGLWFTVYLWRLRRAPLLPRAWPAPQPQTEASRAVA